MDLTEIISLYQFVIMYLIYFAILVHFFYQKTGWKKLHLIIVVIGFFILVETMDFFIAQFLILLWLTLMGIEMLIDRKTVLILLIIAVILPIGGPIFFLLSLTLYVLIVGGFILSAFKEFFEMLSNIKKM